MQLSPGPPQSMAPLIIPQDRPVYRITAEKGFFGPDDHLYGPGSVIAWDDEPNQEMQPLNEKAQVAMREYLKKLDGYGRSAAEKAGRHYNSLLDAHENAIAMAQQDAKRVELITAPKMAPLMGAKKRGRPKVERIEVAPEVPLMGAKGKFSLGKDVVNKADGNI